MMVPLAFRGRKNTLAAGRRTFRPGSAVIIEPAKITGVSFWDKNEVFAAGIAAGNRKHLVLSASYGLQQMLIRLKRDQFFIRVDCLKLWSFTGRQKYFPAVDAFA